MLQSREAVLKALGVLRGAMHSLEDGHDTVLLPQRIYDLCRILLQVSQHCIALFFGQQCFASQGYRIESSLVSGGADIHGAQMSSQWKKNFQNAKVIFLCSRAGGP